MNTPDLPHEPAVDAMIDRAEERANKRSDAACESCFHWELSLESRRTGYCPIFSRRTHAKDGQKCTAYLKCWEV